MTAITLQHTATREPRVSGIHIRRSLSAPTIAEADSLDEAHAMIDALRHIGEDDGPIVVVSVWSDGDEEVVA